jgi:hypothetical protein
MNNKLSKVLTIIAVIIALIGAVFYIRVVMAGDDAIEDSADLQNTIISPFVWLTVIVLIATAGAALLSSVISLVKKPEQLKKTLLSIAVLGVVLVIAYLLKDGSVVLDAQGKIVEGGEEGVASNIWSSTGIWYSIILGGVGLVLFLYDMVKSLIKS